MKNFPTRKGASWYRYFTVPSCSPLGIHGVNGETILSVSVFFLPLNFPHFSVTMFSINSLQFFVSLGLVFYFLTSFQVSLNAVLLKESCSTSPPFLSTFWASVLYQFFLSHPFNMTGPFQPTPHSSPMYSFTKQRTTTRQCICVNSCARINRQEHCTLRAITC